MNRILPLVAFCLLLGVVVKDRFFHFDRKYVEAKQAHRSDQRNWNLFYGQSYVFRDGSFRYQDDLLKMKRFIEPGGLLLTDKATSYHAAAVLPIYVNNVHRHQGRGKRRQWQQFIDQRHFCYQEFDENRQRVGRHLTKHADLKYVILNRDRVSSHRVKDCLAFRSDALGKELPRIAHLVYSGNFLDLYRIKN